MPPPSLPASPAQRFCICLTPQTLTGQKLVQLEKQVTIIRRFKVGTVWRTLEISHSTCPREQFFPHSAHLLCLLRTTDNTFSQFLQHKLQLSVNFR
jgi:hypothetical protein